MTALNNYSTAGDGWTVTEDTFDPGRQRAQETVFGIGNGRFATRGSLDEGHSGANPATLAHGVFAPHHFAHSELANLPDWTALDVHVGGERFSLETGTVESHRRQLDLRRGVLRRDVRWRSPQGRTAELIFERFVSLARPALGATRVRVTAVDFDGPVEVHARLNARAETDGLAHTLFDAQRTEDGAAALSVRIRGRDKWVGLAMRLDVRGASAERRSWDAREQPTLVARWEARSGESATFEKTVALVVNGEGGEQSLDAAAEELSAVDGADFDSLLSESAAAWERDWSDADIVIDGDDEAQLSTRFALFQLLICAPRGDDDVSIGAKGLTGFGYRGHVFWDTETFMLPFFVHFRPEIARNLLSYRHRRLPGARRKAAGNGVSGAQFPWESAESGDEVTPRWLPGPGPELIRIWTGDIAIQITAMVAQAVMRYWRSSGDDSWMAARGAETVIDGARFWASRAEWNGERGRFEYTDVIGPDEYHEHVDNNAYTNRFAAWHLRAAAEVGEWLARTDAARAREILGDEAAANEQLAEFRRVADGIYPGAVRDDGVLEQFDGYFERRHVDLTEYEGRDRSMQAIFGIAGTNETQILKQPDVLMLAALLPESLTHEELLANYEYYTPRTDHSHGSSLGPGIQALLAARLGRVDEAYEHFVRACRVDLADVRGNTADGTHAASHGALWQALVFGFAGVELHADGVRTHPHLPPHWRRLAFRLAHRGETVEVDLRAPASEPARHVSGSGSSAKALIFDLDGVVTDTAELHYQAWQRLADEDGLPFDRQANEKLRGVSRRQSLDLLLAGRFVPESRAEEMMARKNGYYRDLIAEISPDDLLPGALAVIDDGRAKGLRIALASASKNAREVVERLGIADRFEVISDGHSVAQPKPAPDLFLVTAQALGVQPHECVVFEDAADGVTAAQAAGMLTVGIGPHERVGDADVVLTDGFERASLETILDLVDRSRAAAA